MCNVKKEKGKEKTRKKNRKIYQKKKLTLKN